MLNGKPKTDISNVKKRLDNVFGSYNKFTELINLSPVISPLTLSLPSSSNSISSYNNPKYNRNHSTSKQSISNPVDDTQQQISDNEISGFGLMTSAAASIEQNGYGKTNKFSLQRLPTKEVLQSMQNLVKDDLLTNLECSKNMNCIVEDNSIPSTSTQNLFYEKLNDRKRSHRESYKLLETQNKKTKQEEQLQNKLPFTSANEIPNQLVGKSNRELQRELFGDISDDDSLTSDEKSLLNTLTPLTNFLKQSPVGFMSIPISSPISSPNLNQSKSSSLKLATQNNSKFQPQTSSQSQRIFDKEKEKLKEKDTEREKEKEFESYKDKELKKEKKLEELSKRHKKKKELNYDKSILQNSSTMIKDLKSPKIERNNEKVERNRNFEKFKKSDKEKNQIYNVNLLYETMKPTKNKNLAKEDNFKAMTISASNLDYLKEISTNSNNNLTNTSGRLNADNSVNLQQISKSSSPANSVLNSNGITLRNNNDDLHSPDSGFVDGNGSGGGNIGTPSSTSFVTGIVPHQSSNFLTTTTRSTMADMSNNKNRIESILEQITYVTPLLSPISNINYSISLPKREQKALQKLEKTDLNTMKNNYLSENYDLLMTKKEFECELKFDSFAMSSGQTLADLISEKYGRLKNINVNNYENDIDMETKSMISYKPELPAKPLLSQSETDFEKELAKTEAIFEERIKIKDEIIENHELVIVEQRARLHELERISKNYVQDIKLREQIISDLRLEKDSMAQRNELLLERNQRLTKELERISRELEILKRKQPLNVFPWSSYQN